MIRRETFTGNTTSFTKNIENVDKSDFLRRVNTSIRNGRPLTCNFKRNFTVKDAKTDETIKIYERHGYAIVGADETRNYIRLINPWKSGGRSIANSPKSKEGGHIAMAIDDFVKNVYSISAQPI